MIQFSKSLLNLTLLVGCSQFVFADAEPQWEDCPACYEFTAVMNAQVLQDGISIADVGDMLAAFDVDGNVRGLATQEDGIGPFAGQIIYEIIMRSDAGGDVLSFKYYDVSEDAILDAAETYTFLINDLAGTLLNPTFLNVAPPDLGCSPCEDNDAGVAPFTCSQAVAQFGCDFLWGGAPIGDSCPASCGTCPVEDDCGVCDGDNSTCSDCAGTPNGEVEEDCTGECGGSAVVDECGVCEGSGIADGACDCDGNVDAGCGCGEAGPSGCDNACGSTVANDECGVCGGDNSS